VPLVLSPPFYIGIPVGVGLLELPKGDAGVHVYCPRGQVKVI